MSLNKDARAIRDAYGIPYSTALRMIREKGAEAALSELETRKPKQREAERCVHGTNPPSMCEHCGRAGAKP